MFLNQPLACPAFCHLRAPWPDCLACGTGMSFDFFDYSNQSSGYDLAFNNSNTILSDDFSFDIVK